MTTDRLAEASRSSLPGNGRVSHRAIAPLRDAIKALAARGEDATLHEVTDIPHYRSPSFAPVMREEVVPWLSDVWAKDAP